MLTISIIIPVYKVEAYIEECLASVVAQSDAKANIECIIVDDCSPDGSMDIVRRFVDNYQGAVQFRFTSSRSEPRIVCCTQYGY